MQVDAPTAAAELIADAGYYHLSGYWYLFRMRTPDLSARTDRFRPGSTFTDVEAMWIFDQRLRLSVMSALQHIEPAIRAEVVNALADIDPMAHRLPGLLDLRSSNQIDAYNAWIAKLDRLTEDSREEFVAHHSRAGRELPVWATALLLDWGGVSRLFTFAPPAARERVAGRFNLTQRELRSWLRALNILRNLAAHHGRLIARSYALVPREPDSPLVAIAGTSRLFEGNEAATTFGLLTALQYLCRQVTRAGTAMLPMTLDRFPVSANLDRGAIGAPDDWAGRAIWRR